MYNTFAPVVLAITAVLIVFLIFLLFKQGKYNYKSGRTEEKKEQFHSSCPLCGSGLTKTEKVKSVLFKGNPDSLMEIYGCPRCYPVNKSVKRICPVCKKEVEQDGFVIARVFTRPNKTHVHVLGCTSCYKRKF